MNKLLITFSIFGLLAMGCQKNKEDVPVSVSDIAAEQNTETPAAAAENVESDDAADAQEPGRMVLSFDEMGLDADRLKPSFASSVLTKNGVFALMHPGNFRYYRVSGDEISADQYRDYCSSVLQYIQSISDHGDVWRYDVTSSQKLDKITAVDDIALADIFGMTYSIKDKSYVLYVRYHKYDRGTFSDASGDVNAVNLSAWILE